MRLPHWITRPTTLAEQQDAEGLRNIGEITAMLGVGAIVGGLATGQLGAVGTGVLAIGVGAAARRAAP